MAQPDNMQPAANQASRPGGAAPVRVSCTHDIQPSVVRIGKPVNDNRPNLARLSGRLIAVGAGVAAVIAATVLLAGQLI